MGLLSEGVDIEGVMWYCRNMKGIIEEIREKEIWAYKHPWDANAYQSLITLYGKMKEKGDPKGIWRAKQEYALICLRSLRGVEDEN